MNKKDELRKLIDDENGPKFSKNIDLDGWIFYRRDSFISFKIVNVNDVNTVVIQYIYIVNKNDLIKLLSQCINFWTSNDAKFIYFLEHILALSIQVFLIQQLTQYQSQMMN